MQRAARFLLWGGLAALIGGVASCGVGCLAGLESVLGDNPEAAGVASGGGGIGILLFVLGIVMLFTGAILKAVSVRAVRRTERDMAKRRPTVERLGIYDRGRGIHGRRLWFLGDNSGSYVPAVAISILLLTLGALMAYFGQVSGKSREEV